MHPLNHSVRKQILNVRCDSAESALALRPRLAEFNRSDLIPVIERVLSEAAVAGRQIRIKRFEVDLGTIPLSEFETVVAQRLYHELKDAVDRAMRSSRSSEEQSEAASQLDLLEWYLLHGTLPFWAATSSFSLNASFEVLVRQEPGSLAQLVRRTGMTDRVLERIVLQLTVEVLRRLIAVLEPQHAALILIYMADLGEIHHEEPLAIQDGIQFGHLLWFLVLSYLVREAGSQFNRRMFVESLIRGFATQRGLEYSDILLLLAKGLERTRVRRNLESSLPAVISELVRNSQLDEALHSGVPTTAGAAFEDSSPSLEQLVALAETDPFTLAQIIRRYGARTGWLEKLVSVLNDDTLAQLIGILEPEHAAQIIALLFDIGEVHRREPVLTLESGRFVRLLWLLALTYLVQERGSQFNRKAFCLALIQRLAQSEGLDFNEVLAAFRAGLVKTRSMHSLKSSLPVVIAELLDDVGRTERRQSSNLALSGDLAGIPSHEQLTVPLLIETLLHRDTQDSRNAAVSLRTVLHDTTIREEFVRIATPESFHSAIDLLIRPLSRSIGAILSALASLPTADRLSVESARSILLAETLRENSIRETDTDFFQRVLQALFPTPLPDRIRTALLASVPDRETALRSILNAALPNHSTRLAPDHELSAEQILDLLLEARDEPKGQLDAWILALETEFEERSDVGRAEVLRRFANPRLRSRLLRILPESALARLIGFLDPSRQRTMLRAVDTLASAWSLALPANPAERTRHMVWTAVLEVVTGGSPSEDQLVKTVLELFSQQLSAISAADPVHSDASTDFLKHARRLAEESGNRGLHIALDNRAISPRSRPSTANADNPQSLSGRLNSRPPKLRPFYMNTKEQPNANPDPIYIANAGLVLTSPFLPHLFSSLDMLEPADKGVSRWRSPHIASRAVHLLQYLVDARTSAPEPLLVLNKLLCGLPSATPVEAQIEITPRESEICDQLLRAVIANWPIISNTSVEGLRETFLQREGKLERGDDKWKVQVQRKTLDVLVDQIPWSFKIILHDWMAEPIHVTW